MQVLQIWMSFTEQLASIDKACPNWNIASKTKNTSIVLPKENDVTESQLRMGWQNDFKNIDKKNFKKYNQVLYQPQVKCSRALSKI